MARGADPTIAGGLLPLDRSECLCTALGGPGHPRDRGAWSSGESLAWLAGGNERLTRSAVWEDRRLTKRLARPPTEDLRRGVHRTDSPVSELVPHLPTR